MTKVLGFFNLFFGILETHGFFRHIRNQSTTISSASFISLNETIYKALLYPILLLVVGIFNLVLGMINLGAIPPKNKKQKLINIISGSVLIFLSSVLFWDLIVSQFLKEQLFNFLLV